MSLIEKLREAGTLDSRGSFTLDRRKAREKMARFQLTDPRRYILELVEAAVALGAAEVDVTLDSAVEVGFAGAPLPPDLLASLDDFLLSVPSQPEEYALRAVAMACAALGTLKVTRIRVESSAGAWLERTASGDSTGTGALSGNRIRVEGALGWAGALGGTAEEKLLRAEALYSPVPVRVNGKDVRGALRLPRLGRERSEERDGVRFRAAIAREWNDSSLTLVSRGVVASRREIVLPAPLVAVVWHDGLARNASHSDVVEDARYQALLRDLAELSERCAEGLAEDLLAGDLGEDSEQARSLLVHLARQRKPPLPAIYESAPLLRDQRGRPLSLADLEAQRRSLGVVPVTEHRLATDVADLRVAWARNAVERALLENRFGKSVQDAASHVLRLMRRQQNVQRWEASPRPAELPPGEWILRRRLKEPAGEIGVSPRDTDAGSVLHVLHQGRLLETRPIPSALSYVAVLDFPELEIDDEWSSARETDAWKRALEALEREGQALYADLARRGGPWTRAEHDHLLLALEARKAVEPFRSVPLFPELRGDVLSLADLQGRRAVYLVDPSEAGFPEGLPAAMLPEEPFLRVNPRERQVLSQAVPALFQPAGPELQRLGELANRFRHRRAPRLDGPEDFAAMVSFRDREVEGQLGLGGGREGGRLVLLREGVFLGTREVKPLGPPFLAVVENPSFVPLPSWNGVEADRAWSQVLARVREAEVEARRRLVEDWGSGVLPDGVRDLVKRCLAVEPSLADLAGDRPLFLAAEGLVSLPRIREELARAGSVLVAPDSEAIELEGRLVLLESAVAEVRPLLPESRWESARPLLQARVARESFLARPESPLRLPMGSLLERRLPAPRTGSVGLVEALGGVVEVHLEGRLLECCGKVLPKATRAVLEDPALRPDPTWTSVRRDAAWDAMVRDLAEEVGRLAREALDRGPAPGSREACLLLSLLPWKLLPEPARARLEEAPLLRALPDEAISLAEARHRLGGAPRLLVAPPSVRVRPLDGRMVVVVEEGLAKLLEELLGRPTRDDSNALEQDRLYQVKMDLASKMSRDLPRCLARIEVEGPLFRGSLGFPARGRTGSFVALRKGAPLGRIEMPHHLSVGVLEGEFHLGKDGLLQPLSRDQRRELRAGQVTLYGALVEAFPRLQGRDRAQAASALLAFGAEERSAVGARSPAGEVLEALMALPLVEVAGGRQASPAALAAEVEATGSLVFLPRQPLTSFSMGDRLLPILPRGKPARLFCERVVAPGRLEEVPMPTLGQRLARAGSGAADLLAKGVGATFGWLGNTLDQVGRLLASDGPPVRGGGAAEAPQPLQARAHEEDDPDTLLLKALRREFSLVAKGRVRKHAVRRIEQVRWGMRPLGAPAWIDEEGRLCLNGLNGTIRFIRDRHLEDPGLVSLLLAHLIGMANEASAEVSDRDEQEFLLELVRDLEASYPG